MIHKVYSVVSSSILMYCFLNSVETFSIFQIKTPKKNILNAFKVETGAKGRGGGVDFL